MLELLDIHKSYHDGEGALAVLCGVELELAAGDSIALLGASGSGKSTLLQIAAGLERPDRGDVRFRGRSLRAMRERDLALLRRRELGFVFQSFNLLPGLNVEENLLFQRRLNRMPDHDAWTADLLEGLQLTTLLRRPVEVLSGGQQQRVAIARALAHRPRLVFADEPTGNLHDTMSRQVLTLLIRLVDESGSALLLVTHNRELAAMTHRRFRLSGGQLQAEVPEPVQCPVP